MVPLEPGTWPQEWRRLVREKQEREAAGRALVIRCPDHPERPMVADPDSDPPRFACVDPGCATAVLLTVDPTEED